MCIASTCDRMFQKTVTMNEHTSVIKQQVALPSIEKNEMGWACGTYGRGEGGV